MNELFLFQEYFDLKHVDLDQYSSEMNWFKWSNLMIKIVLFISNLEVYSRISSREVGRTVRDMDERRSRRDGSPGGSECLSAFYRDRFGDHSPEDYLNLRMSQFDKGLSKDSIRSILEKEFKHMAPFEV